jgi:hypothetical protein
MTTETQEPEQQAKHRREASELSDLLVCDHDFEWVDESYDHEFGVEQCGHYECTECGEVDSDRPYEYEPLPDDVM